MRVHELKCWPASFGPIIDGVKRHEIRSTRDREFAAGDVLRLYEWAPGKEGGYSGRIVDVKVLHVNQGGDWGLPEDLCVMSIQLTGRR